MKSYGNLPLTSHYPVKLLQKCTRDLNIIVVGRPVPVKLDNRRDMQYRPVIPSRLLFCYVVTLKNKNTKCIDLYNLFK